MIQLFILTYNRPQMVVHAVRSALAQDFKELVVVVSDNSTNEDTMEMLSNEFKDNSRFFYIKREHTLSPIGHFNKVLSEVNSEFFMLFHDDDIMDSNMITSLIQEFTDESIVAVGANSRISVSGSLRKKPMWLSSKSKMFINDSTTFIKPYLNNGGIIPFPAYLYRKRMVGDLRMRTENGGKFCDVAFLVDVSNLGRIVWIKTPLMTYYIHQGQDSFSNSFIDRLKLIKYICHQTTLNLRSPLIIQYRLYNIFLELKNDVVQKNIQHTKRYLFAMYLSIKYSKLWIMPRIFYYLPRFLFANIKK